MLYIMIDSNIDSELEGSKMAYYSRLLELGAQVAPLYHRVLISRAQEVLGAKYGNRWAEELAR